MSWLQDAFIASHKFVFRATGGAIGSRLAGIQHLLLTTTGRRTGLPREHPLACFEQDGKLLIVASKGGADEHPAWYLNLVDEPRVEVHHRGERARRLARTALPEERAALWPELVRQNRMYGTYERRTTREIPVVVLDPAD